MNETDYNERIKRGLILFLREVHNIYATDAWLEESEVERGWFSGCETCGYGGDDDAITTDLKYKTLDATYASRVTLRESSLDFLPTLLPYIDRAN